METQASVAKGATSLYAANVVILVANTLYFLVLTNLLHSTLGVGIVTALNIMIWLLVTVSILAQPIAQQSPVPAPLAVLKFIPELLTKKARSGASKLFRASLAFTLTIGGVIMGILLATPGLVIPFIGGQAVLPLYVQLSGIDILVLSLGQVCIGALVAMGNMRSATAYLILWGVIRYALASLLLVAFAISGVLIGWILGDALLLVFALQKSITSLRTGAGRSRFSFPDLVRYSLYTLLSALIGFAVNQADKIFTLARQGLPELAIYNVAIVAASFAGFAPYVLLIVLLPALSALHAAKRTRQMHEMIRAYTRYVSIVVLPIAFGFASIMEVALRIFGPEYLNGLIPSVIVSVATGLTSVGAVYAGALLAVGKLKWFTGANAIGLVGLIIVSYFLTPIFGLGGPALGRATLMALVAVVYGVALLRSGLFEFDVRAFLSATVASTVMGVVIFFALTLAHSFLLQLAMLPIVVVAGTLIYLGSLRALRLLTVRDLEFVRDLTPTRLQVLLPAVAKFVGLRWKEK
ncbi:MAG: lipopolysaccharide biosynthesis protein [Candidatus Bathyarchaeia archaeon]